MKTYHEFMDAYGMEDTEIIRELYKEEYNAYMELNLALDERGITHGR